MIVKGPPILKDVIAIVICLSGFLQLSGCSDSLAKSDCTRACTIQDKNLECWKQSLAYFTNKLQEAIAEYSGTIMHIEIWKQRNSNKETQYEDFEWNILKDVLSEYEDETNILPKTDMFSIFRDILNMTSAQKHRYSDGEILPKFGCPTPCLYESTMLQVLSGVLFAILLIFIACFIAYFIRTQRKLEKLSRQKLFEPNHR